LHPTLIQAKSQLANLHGSLDQAVRRAGARMEQSYAAAVATENSLTQALAGQEGKATNLNRTAIPYHSLERQVQANASMYQKILDNLRQMDLSHRLLTPNEVEGTVIRVLSAPLVPDHPSFPRRRLFLAAAAAAGLILGSAGVLLR